MASVFSTSDLEDLKIPASDPEFSIQFSSNACVNNRFWGLNFTTAANELRFGSRPPVDEPPFLFALDTTSWPKTDKGQRIGKSVSEILQALGVNDESKTDSKSLGYGQHFFWAIVSLLSGVKFVLSEDRLKPVPRDPNTDEIRNAMWVTQGFFVRAETALSFVPDKLDTTSLISKIEDLINLRLEGLDVKPPTLIVLRRAIASKYVVPSDDELTPSTWSWLAWSTAKLTWKIPIGNFTLWITLENGSGEVSITPATIVTDDGTTEGSIKSMVKDLPSDPVFPEVDTLLNNIRLIRLTLRLKPKGFSWAVMTGVQFSSNGPDLYLGYDAETSTFSGGLLLSQFYAPTKLTPEFRYGFDVVAPIGRVIPSSWDLRDAFRDLPIPSTLPTNIVLASMTYQRSKRPAPSTLSFTATARYIVPDRSTWQQPQDPSTPSGFQWDEFDVSFTKSGPAISCSLKTMALLQMPPPIDQQIYRPAFVSVSVDYSSQSGWTLRGNVMNLSAGFLTLFFDPASQDAALDVIGKLTIESLDVLWTHNKAGGAAGFLFSGVITLGELKLRLFFQLLTKNASSTTSQAIQSELDTKQAASSSGRAPPKALNGATPPKETTWSFECDLDTATDKATIGSIAESIIDDAADILPPFVYNIPIPKAENGSGASPIMIRAAKTILKSDPVVDGQTLTPKYKLVFVFCFTIGPFAATFIQIADAVKGPVRGPTKRMLRLAVGKLPIKGNIPLLDRLPQPFDKLEYVWVSETGLTRREVDTVNESGLLPPGDSILVKASTSTTGSQSSSTRPDGTPSARPAPGGDPVVLQGGHHFIVIQSGKVSLDHVFNASPNGKPPAPSIMSLNSQDNVVAAAGLTTPNPSQPSKGSVGLRLGPLSIQGVTLQFKERDGKKALWITLDATFAMGPISFSLFGFGLIITLGENVTLSNLIDAVDDIDVTLAGMAIAFNKPPLLIAGGFERKQLPGMDIFLGAIGVGFPPYTFLGMGEYASVELMKDGKLEKYKSVFLYCKLDGPLITLQFATITGVRIGFGYNSFVESPTLDELTSFPFINDGSASGTGNDPMALLKRLTEPSASGKTWVSPRLDSYWLAAGLSITAFDILTVTAVAMLSFGKQGFVISLFADAVATMPPKAPHGIAIVYVELTMMAEVNFATGQFKIMAALAPTSYLLVPQCSIYGQMALAYWFPPSDHAGDWVLSVGGYHRSYTPPAHYPKPRRLGIAFNVDVISIVGEAYFAVTPKCVMGGAMMHASLEFGPLYAWMDFTFDAFINFHPLHYTLDMSISIGIKSHVDFIFINSHTAVHINARLHIEGPEFGGTAHVEFFIFSFDFDFGSPPRQPDPLTLPQFYDMVHKPGPQADDKSEHNGDVLAWLVGQDQTFDGAALKYVLEDGNFPKQPSKDDNLDPNDASKGDPKSTGAGTKWFVKGGSFIFRINVDYALNDATISTASDDSTTRHFDSYVAGSSAPIYSKPMHITQAMGSAASTLAIKVQRVTINEDNEVTLESPIDAWRTFTLTYEPMPTAIWSAYDPNTDPGRGNSRPSNLLTSKDGTVKQAMGVRLTPPEPILCPRPEWPGFIPKVRATGMAKLGILDFRTNKDGDNWYIPKANDKQVRFLPAALTQTQQEKPKSRLDQWNDMASTWSKFESFEAFQNKRNVTGDLQVTRKRGATSDEGEDAEVKIVEETEEEKKTKAEQAAKDAIDKAERQDRVDLVAALLSGVSQVCQWDQKRPQMSAAEQDIEDLRAQDTKLHSWELTGAVPRKLVKDLKRAYLDLPQLAVVSA